MKYSTSTLGCLAWDLPTIAGRLPRYGYQAVDFRGLRGNLKLWELPEFSADLAASAALLRDAGLAVSAFSASARLVWQTADERDRARDELRHTVELCHRFDCRQIRVFGGQPKDASRAEALARGRAELAEWLALAAPAGVQLAVETHDAWTNSADLLALLAGTDPQQVGVVWDVKHPYWTSHETPAATWTRLRERVVNTHWKDARRDHATGKDRLCLCGTGVLPLADFLDVLVAGGYAGYYTLEWERQWHPYLADAEIAFPQFVRYMKQLRTGREPKS
jgi:sugar phosphate isomerase/epimerase